MGHLISTACPALSSLSFHSQISPHSPDSASGQRCTVSSRSRCVGSWVGFDSFFSIIFFSFFFKLECPISFFLTHNWQNILTSFNNKLGSIPFFYQTFILLKILTILLFSTATWSISLVSFKLFIIYFAISDEINLLKTDYTLRCFMAKSSIKIFFHNLLMEQRAPR